MYDELVKRLREVAGEVDNDYDVDPYDAEQRCLAILQAADAIENTSKAYQMMAEAYEAEVTKQCWIPVEEKLPRMWEEVMLRFPNNQAVGFHDGDSGWAVFSGDNLYTYVAPEEVHPTHWMPLP